MDVEFNILQALKDISSYTIPFMAIMGFLAYIIKPVRMRISSFIKKYANTDKQNKEIEELRQTHEADIDKITQEQENKFAEMIDKQNKQWEKVNEKLDFLIEENKADAERTELYNKIHICTLRNRIVNIYFKYLDEEYIKSFEKQLLIEHYELYKSKVLNGNGYIDEIYKTLMDKKVKL